MRRPSRSGLSLVFALCVHIPLTAQNLESIGKEKPFYFSGGLSVNQTFYASRGIPSRREPYAYFASGNLNISLYGWSIPLSFTLSNHHSAFAQPFNQYAVHPTWKSVTVHAGYTSMSFSPYTVNGHIFLGGGIDIAPKGKWKFSALYGRFLKAVERDTSALHSLTPAFQRMGYGLKVSYGQGGNSIDVIVFHAEDDPASIHHSLDSLGITPHENFVASLGAQKKIFKQFLLKGEFANSAITRDVRADKTNPRHPLAGVKGLLQPRTSSSYYNAVKTSFDYQQKGYTVGVSWERIDPEYRTLGAYYFNNDLENITLNTSATILDNKLTVAGSGGVQRNNLDKSKISTMRRMVGSLNLQYAHSERLNLSGSWSSFQTYTNIRSPFESINQLTTYHSIDTLNFTQISKNASLSGMYGFSGSENKKQNVNLHASWQDATDKQDQAKQPSGTRFYNITIGYSLLLVPREFRLAATFNTSINEGPFTQTKMLGPTVLVSKSFLHRKLRTTLSSSCNNTYSNGMNINTIINLRMSGAISIRNQHNINISAVAMKRSTTNAEGNGKSFTEFTGTLGYSYGFGSGRP